MEVLKESGFMSVRTRNKHKMSVADPIHGIIQFDRNDPNHNLLLEIINCKPFQRLRRIKQMGLAEFVFPGATHSRFGHSLGAVYLMITLVQQLKQDPDAAVLLASEYEDTGITLELLLLVGILVHDIGHTPLSHTLEDILDLKEAGRLHDHYWNKRILTEDPEFQAVWERFGPNIPKAVLSFLGDSGQPRHFLAALVSSQLDMDRLDYLQRDSHYLGVQYGRIEAQRIIASMAIGQRKNGQTVVAVREESVPAVEHYLFGRHQAYKMALHSLDKASEVILKCTLKRFHWAVQHGINTGRDAQQLYKLMDPNSDLSIQEYLRMDDCYLWESLNEWADHAQDELLQELANRMLKHQLFKFIDLRKYGHPGSLQDLPEIYDALQGHYAKRKLDFNFCFDEVEVKPKPLYLPPEERDPIWVKTFRGSVVDLAQVSSLPLYAAPERGEKHLVFVWDNSAKRFLLDQLEKQFPKGEMFIEDEEDAF